MKLREKVWDLLEARHDRNNDGKRDLDWFDKSVIVLIIMNVIAIVAGTDPRLSSAWLTWFEWISVGFFTLEYIARIWACTADDAYG